MNAVDTNVVVRLLTADDPKQSVAAALELTAHGIEFADAIHFSNRPAGAVFVSFDKTFACRARHAGAVDISGMPAE